MNFIDHNHQLIAILRGIKPEETEEMITALIEIGYRAIEIPLNSPDPFGSIKVAVETANRLAPEECLIGAGTVLSVDEVTKVKAVGGNLIVSPNIDPEVIKATRKLDMQSYPGVFSPTEAHLALASGANGLKFFPAMIMGPAGIKAFMTILPPYTKSYAVGGIMPAEFNAYMKAGAYGFGMATAIYKSGAKIDEVRMHASLAMDALQVAITG